MNVKLNQNEETLVPGNRRRIQIRRTRRKDLFGKRKKEVFLEVLACTANVMAAAEAAGVATATVYAHRRKDAEFRELWWIALEQGVAKLAALRIQREIERAEAAAGARSGEKQGGAGSPSSSLGTGLEVALDGPPDTRQIADLYKLMQLMREHSRGLSGAAKGGCRPPEKASIEEACEALAKRLRQAGLGKGMAAGSDAGARA